MKDYTSIIRGFIALGLIQSTELDYIDNGPCSNTLMGKTMYFKERKFRSFFSAVKKMVKENPEVYRNRLRMNEDQFAYFLEKVNSEWG